MSLTCQPVGWYPVASIIKIEIHINTSVVLLRGGSFFSKVSAIVSALANILQKVDLQSYIILVLLLVTKLVTKLVP
jgi:hypothetical protein